MTLNTIFNVFSWIGTCNKDSTRKWQCDIIFLCLRLGFKCECLGSEVLLLISKIVQIWCSFDLGPQWKPTLSSWSIKAQWLSSCQIGYLYVDICPPKHLSSTLMIEDNYYITRAHLLKEAKTLCCIMARRDQHKANGLTFMPVFWHGCIF